MYLLIDWGNTHLNYFLCEELEPNHIALANDYPATTDSIEGLFHELSTQIDINNISRVLVASVRSETDNERLYQALNKRSIGFFVAKTEKRACGVECFYKKPGEFGVDRWLALIAASQSTGSIGVFDIGSAITLDIISSSKQHLGGHILPGKNLLHQSLSGTANVHSRNLFIESTQFRLGSSTQECLNSGIEQMIGAYLLRSLSLACEAYNTKTWILTGGGGLFWLDFLKKHSDSTSELELTYQPNLVLSGLALLYIEKHLSKA